MATSLADEALVQRSDPKPTPEQLEFFETQVRPLLVKRCHKCHSTESGPENGSLILDTAAGIAAGGSRGSMFHKEMPDKGLLLQVITYRDADLQMPPDGKLAAAELAILERWVRDGAALPEYKAEPRPKLSKVDWVEGRKFWSFQPLRPTPLPMISDPQWVARPLDTFVLAKLSAHKLTPNPPADRAQLLRRMTFDLTGLPPTPDELDAFVADNSAQSVERLVDRLLASHKTYGRLLSTLTVLHYAIQFRRGESIMAKCTNETTTSKVSPLMVRLDAESKRSLTDAAELRRISVSDYVRTVTVAQARREVASARDQTIQLSPDEQLAFWQALQASAKLSPAQKRLGAIMRGQR